MIIDTYIDRISRTLNGVMGADYVLHVGGMVSPAADYFPKKTLKVNTTAAQYIVDAVKAQPNSDRIKAVLYRLRSANRPP